MINTVLEVNTEYNLAVCGEMAEPWAPSEGLSQGGAGFLGIYYQGFHETSYQRDVREFFREPESHRNILAVQTSHFFLHVQRQPTPLEGQCGQLWAGSRELCAVTR